MSDTREKVAKALWESYCLVGDPKAWADAAIAAMVAARWAPLSAECTYCGNEYPMPKLSPKTREILMRGLAVVEYEEQCAMPDSGREYWMAIANARAELEALP